MIGVVVDKRIAHGGHHADEWNLGHASISQNYVRWPDAHCDDVGRITEIERSCADV